MGAVYPTQGAVHKFNGQNGENNLVLVLDTRSISSTSQKILRQDPSPSDPDAWLTFFAHANALHPLPSTCDQWAASKHVKPAFMNPGCGVLPRHHASSTHLMNRRPRIAALIYLQRHACVVLAPSYRGCSKSREKFESPFQATPSLRLTARRWASNSSTRASSMTA